MTSPQSLCVTPRFSVL